MALEVERVVGGGVQVEEALGGAGRFEPLHLAFAPADRLMRDLGAVGLSPALLMAGRRTDLTEGGPVGPELIGVTWVGAKP